MEEEVSLPWIFSSVIVVPYDFDVLLAYDLAIYDRWHSVGAFGRGKVMLPDRCGVLGFLFGCVARMHGY